MTVKHQELILEAFLKLRKVSTDTRNIAGDSIFFALKGANFNGNHYAADALEKGAALAVVDEAEYAIDDRFILVGDGLKALQDLARDYRDQFHIPLIALTGSNGKTTTKELIAVALSERYDTLYTKGNFNNHIGVPLTLLQIREHHEVAVIEMGANHQKEIELLCSIAKPTHGLITNIGHAHLEGFGGIEGVKKGKGELADYLASSGGTFFYNDSDKRLVDLSERTAHSLAYGLTERLSDNFYRSQFLSADPYLKMKMVDDNGIEHDVQTQMQGEYNAHNVATAIAIAHYFKVSPEGIKKAIESYLPENNRSQLKTLASNDFFLDAYNANPDSMALSVNSFMLRTSDKQKMLILGDMKELGSYSEEAHRAVIEQIKKNYDVQCAFVGNEFLQLKAESPDYHFFKNVSELITWFKTGAFTNKFILLKGSRSIGLEKLIQSL